MRSEVMAHQLEVIRTPRLDLVAMVPELARAALSDRASVCRRLGASVPLSWPGPDFGEALPYIAGQIITRPEFGFWVRLMVLREEGRLIGDIGFTDLPDSSGTVEIGYSIVPEEWGKGYATEAAGAMVSWAFTQHGVSRVIAQCLSDNTASARVLQKVGMRQTDATEELLAWEILPDRDHDRRASE